MSYSTINQQKIAVMKILVVSNVQTYPTTSGSAKFISDYSELLKSFGHDVFFLHVTYYAFSSSNKTRIDGSAKTTQEKWGKDHYFRYQMSLYDKLCEMTKTYYHKFFTKGYAGIDDKYAHGLGSYINKLDRKHHFDACIVNYYWLTKALTEISIPRKAIVAHDSFTYNNLRNGVNSTLNLTPNEEAKAMQRCPTIFAMQDEEAAFYRRLSPKSKVLVSYCNYDYEQQPVAGNHNLVFLSGGFYLNVNGLNWFVDNILPAIVQKYPDCKLIVGGTICREIQHLKSLPYIEIVGFVESAADFYAKGDVAINPTYQGTGLKIKTFEAMAYDKVTMVHPHSMGGIFDKANAPIFSSEDAQDWISFLNTIWTEDKKEIQNIKARNKKYILSMNDFIRSQFESFLS